MFYAETFGKAFAGLTLVASLACTTAAHAFDNTVKQITIVHGYGAGGTYDQFSRLFAAHLRKHLPGNPNIIVQSMPGAGGLRLVHHAANTMPADGTQLFMPPDTMVVSQVVDPDARFDARGFKYVGAANSESCLWVLRSDAARSVDDLRSKEVASGNSGTGSTGFLIPAFAAQALGLKVRLVAGYKGSSETILAMERREVDGGAFGWGTWVTSVPQWFTKGSEIAYPILQVGAKPDPEFPNVPMLHSLVGKDDLPVAHLLDTIGVIGRGLALPPKATREHLNAYRSAFDKMLKDPEFLADAERQKLRILPTSGDGIEKVIKTALDNANATVVAKARQALASK